MSRTIYKEPLNSMLRYQLDMTDSADNSKAISIQGLNKYYKKLHAVKDVSFEVTRGDFFGFLGPNGAGKTTTINVITGLSNYASGHGSCAGKRRYKGLSSDPAPGGLVRPGVQF